MTPRIHLFTDCSVPEAALYAMRVLAEPLGFEVTEGTGGDAEALQRAGAVAWSYGTGFQDLPAAARLHVEAARGFWERYGRTESLPAMPYPRVPPALLEGNGPSAGQSAVVPFVVSGEDPPVAWRQDGKRRCLRTRLDLVASAFFWLTRYEEALIGERDAWGRVPEDRLSLVRAGLADRAPVDEYRELLAVWFGRLLGRPPSRPTRFQVLFSHDVDSGFRVVRGPFWTHTARGMARDVLRHRSPRTALELGANAVAARLERPLPFGSVRHILDLAERHGLTSHFFFMANGTHRDDAAYDVLAPGTRQALATIRDAGHRIGLHTGLDAAVDASLLRREWDLLAHALAATPRGVRTHFLRFEVPWTARLAQEVGARFDSSAGFADRCGFRTGTTRPHVVFDLESRRALDLVEYPIAIMDKAVYNLAPGARRVVVSRVIEAVRRHGGCLTINWHYWYFTHRYRTLCEEVLAAARGGHDARVP